MMCCIYLCMHKEIMSKGYEIIFVVCSLRNYNVMAYIWISNYCVLSFSRKVENKCHITQRSYAYSFSLPYDDYSTWFSPHMYTHRCTRAHMKSIVKRMAGTSRKRWNCLKLLLQCNWISFSHTHTRANTYPRTHTKEKENTQQRQISTCSATPPFDDEPDSFDVHFTLQSQYSKSDIIWLHRCTHCVSKPFVCPGSREREYVYLTICASCFSQFQVFYFCTISCPYSLCLYRIRFRLLRIERKADRMSRFSIDLSIFISVSQSITIWYWI